MGDRFSRRTRNPSASDDRIVGRAFVTTVPEIESGEELHVMISPVGVAGEVRARVPHRYMSERGLPPVGTQLYYTQTFDGTYLVLGAFAQLGEDEDPHRKERVVDHPHSDTEVTFNEDGGIHVDAAADATVTVDGDVTINPTGDVVVEGGDVIADDVSLKEHTHDFDYVGGGENSSTLSGTTEDP